MCHAYQKVLLIFCCLFGICNTAQANFCPTEHSVATYQGNAYWVDHCTLHPFIANEVLNALILNQHKQPVPLLQAQFISLPIGEKYTLLKYTEDFQTRQMSLSELCALYENTVVTFDGIVFFKIQNCQRHALDIHAQSDQNTVVQGIFRAIPPKAITQFPLGAPIPNKEAKDISGVFTPSVSELTLLEHLPPPDTLCQGVDHKLTAFMGQFFFIDQCIKHPVAHVSLAEQVKWDSQGGVVELTRAQVLGLPTGNSIKLFNK